MFARFQKEKFEQNEKEQQLHHIENLTNQEILNFLQRRSRRDDFLLLISSNLLRKAARQRQYLEDLNARKYTGVKISVMNLTVQQLKRACLTKNLIEYFHFMSYRYTIHHHSLLGMKLVTNFPEQYEVGQQAQQYHNSTSELLNKQYLPYRSGNIPPESDSEEQQRQDSSLEGFIVGSDEEEQQDYDGQSLSQQEKSQPQEQQENQKENEQVNFETLQNYLINLEQDQAKPKRKKIKLNEKQINEKVTFSTKKKRNKMTIEDDQ